MRDQDKEEFEKYVEENKSIYFGLPEWEVDTDRTIWEAACNYMRNRSPLDSVSLYDKLEKERDRSEVLVEALEKLSLYVSHNGDTWVKERATEALKKYRGES
jgi:hypothetical protein